MFPSRRTLGAVRVPNWFPHVHKRASYGPLWIPHGFANTRKISGVGLYRAQWGPWVHALVLYTRPNLSIAIWHLTCTGYVRARQDCLGASVYGHKIVGSPCLKVLHAQLPVAAILHPYGSKNLRKIVWVLVRDPVKSASEHTGYINQGKPEYVPFIPYMPCAPEDCLGTFYGHKIVGSFACSAFRHGYTIPLSDLKVFGKEMRARMTCPVITHGFPRSWPLNCPGASWCRFDLNIVSAYKITLALCGHMCFTGSISVLTTFWSRDFKNPYEYPLKFRKVHMQVPCGPVRMLYANTRTINRVGRTWPCGAYERSVRGS